jgi:hypothetical protein
MIPITVVQIPSPCGGLRACLTRGWHVVRHAQRGSRNARASHRPIRCSRRDFYSGCITTSTDEARHMGKYIIAWILGVPAFVLVIAYFFFR